MIRIPVICHGGTDGGELKANHLAVREMLVALRERIWRCVPITGDYSSLNDYMEAVKEHHQRLGAVERLLADYVAIIESLETQLNLRKTRVDATLVRLHRTWPPPLAMKDPP